MKYLPNVLKVPVIGLLVLGCFGLADAIGQELNPEKKREYASHMASFVLSSNVDVRRKSALALSIKFPEIFTADLGFLKGEVPLHWRDLKALENLEPGEGLAEEILFLARKASLQRMPKEVEGQIVMPGAVKSEALKFLFPPETDTLPERPLLPFDPGSKLGQGNPILWKALALESERKAPEKAVLLGVTDALDTIARPLGKALSLEILDTVLEGQMKLRPNEYALVMLNLRQNIEDGIADLGALSSLENGTISYTSKKDLQTARVDLLELAFEKSGADAEHALEVFYGEIVDFTQDHRRTEKRYSAIDLYLEAFEGEQPVEHLIFASRREQKQKIASLSLEAFSYVVGPWLRQQENKSISFDGQPAVAPVTNIKSIIRPAVSTSEKVFNEVVEVLKYYRALEDGKMALSDYPEVRNDLRTILFAECKRMVDEERHISLTECLAMSDEDWGNLFGYLRWSPKFWSPDFWDDNEASIQRFGSIQPDLVDYHRTQVWAIQSILNRLAGADPLEKAGLVAVDVDRLHHVSKKLREKDQDNATVIGRVYAPLLASMTRTEFQVKNTDDGFVLDGGAVEALSTNAVLAFLREGEILPAVEASLSASLTNRFVRQKLENDLAYQIIDDFRNEANDINVRENIKKSVERYLSGRQDLQQHPVLRCLGHGLDQNISFGLDKYFGSDLYSEAVAELLYMYMARSLESEGEHIHRSALFSFGPDMSDGKIWRNKKHAQVYKKSTEKYALARSIYEFLGNREGFRPEWHPFGYNGLMKLNPSRQVRKPASKPVDFCRATILQMVPCEDREGLAAISTNLSDSALGVVLARGVTRTGTALDRLGRGHDAFGMDGRIFTPKIENDVDSLATNLREVARLLRGDLKNARKSFETLLSQQRFEQLAEAADADVYVESYELASMRIALESAKLERDVAKLNQLQEDTERAAHHFDVEAARLLADAKMNFAGGELLDENLRMFDAFETQVQEEILATALPAYDIQLKKAILTLELVEVKIAKLEEILTTKRQQYLSQKDKKDIGKLVRQIVVQVADIVCVCYGLPPLGSIIDRTVDGIQAVSDGNLDGALASFGDALKLSGADKMMKGMLDDGLSELGINDLVNDLDDIYEKSGLKDLCKSSGLEDLAEAKGLALLSSATKSFVPEEVVDWVLPPEDHAWANEVDADEMLNTLVGAATQTGKEQLKNLGRSGLNELLEHVAKDSMTIPSEKKMVEIFTKRGLKVTKGKALFESYNNDFVKGGKNIGVYSEFERFLVANGVVKSEEVTIGPLTKENVKQKQKVEETRRNLTAVWVDIKSMSSTYRFAVKVLDIEPGQNFEKQLNEGWKSVRSASLASMKEIIIQYGAKSEKAQEELAKEAVAVELSNNVVGLDAGKQEELRIIVTEIRSNGFSSAAKEGLKTFTKNFDLPVAEKAKEAFKLVKEGKPLDAAVNHFTGSLGKALVNNQMKGVLSTVDSMAEKNANLKADAAQFSKDFTASWKEANAAHDADLKDCLIALRGTASLTVSIQLTKQFRPQTQGRIVSVCAKWEQELNELLGGLRADSALGRQVAGDIDGYFQSIRQHCRQVDLKKLLNEEEFKVLMNAPEVSLREETRHELFKVESAVGKARNLLNAVKANQKKMEDQIHQIYKAEDNSAYQEAKTSLFSGVKEAASESGDSLREAANALGSINNFMAANVGKIGEIRESANATAKAMEYKARGASLPQKLTQEGIRAIDRKAGSKYVDYLIKANPDNLPQDREVLEFILFSPEKAKEHFTENGKINQGKLDAASESTVRWIRGNLGGQNKGDNTPAGLWGTLRSLQVNIWKDEVEHKKAELVVKGKTAEAFAAGMSASGARARQQAQLVAVKSAKVRVKIAEKFVAELEQQVKAQEFRLESAEHQFSAAQSQADLAALDRHVFRAAGEVKAINAKDLMVLDRLAWKMVRDIAFTSRFLQKNGDLTPTISDFIQNNPKAFKEGRWTPNGLDGLVRALKFQELKKKILGSEINNVRYHHPQDPSMLKDGAIAGEGVILNVQRLQEKGISIVEDGEKLRLFFVTLKPSDHAEPIYRNVGRSYLNTHHNIGANLQKTIREEDLGVVLDVQRFDARGHRYLCTLASFDGVENQFNIPVRVQHTGKGYTLGRGRKAVRVDWSGLPLGPEDKVRVEGKAVPVASNNPLAKENDWFQNTVNQDGFHFEEINDLIQTTKMSPYFGYPYFGTYAIYIEEEDLKKIKGYIRLDLVGITF